MKIDWESQASHILFNPRLPQNIQESLKHQATLPGTLYIATSGTTALPKLVVLSKHAFLVSAAAVNHQLDSSEQDIWHSPLPLFHVGGLSILARAHLSGAAVIPWNLPKWSHTNYLEQLKRGVTLSSLVPTQLYDLIQANASPPPSLRTLFIGGDALSESLFKQAQALGWPVTPTYGLTECASQVAVGNPLQPLRHVTLNVIDGILQIKSDALLTGYLDADGTFQDPKIDGWFRTEDRAALHPNHIHLHGRNRDWVQIGAETVHIPKLQTHLEALFGPIGHIVPHKDPRLGVTLYLHLKDSLSAKTFVEQFNKTVLPFERLRGQA
ncbi:MAG: AMP-binding protein [Chlamydiia bacterium]|nr:AMP-binding protein [Chlamydiia bacterium]